MIYAGSLLPEIGTMTVYTSEGFLNYQKLAVQLSSRKDHGKKLASAGAILKGALKVAAYAPEIISFFRKLFNRKSKKEGKKVASAYDDEEEEKKPQMKIFSSQSRKYASAQQGRPLAIMPESDGDA